VTDTQGHLLHVDVHPANASDTVEGCEVFEAALRFYPSLEGVCGDAGYRGTFVNYVKNVLHKTVDIVEKLPEGWRILPKRWVVERTLGWLNTCRRLSKDVEITVDSAQAMVRLAHSRLLLKRTCYL
jgi:putative transposase